MNDPYSVLGVDRNADADTIKKAYRKLARELHPDVNPDPSAQERFKDVGKAYEVLSDPDKRRIFDTGGDPFGGASGAGGGATGGFSFTDVMDAFFGGSGAQARGPRSRTQRGQDALVRMHVDLAEAAFGTTRELKVDTAVVCGACSGKGAAPGITPVTCETCRGHGEVQQVQRSFLGEVRTLRPCSACRGFGEIIPEPCRECAGDGRVRSRRTINVKIPQGVDAGTRVQLVGEGEVGPGGGPPGDLYVEMHVAEHPVFLRDGTTLSCTIEVPMTAAALGTVVSMPTLEADIEEESRPEGASESIEIDIEPGTDSGTEVTMAGLGVPHLRHQGRGDLVVTIEVETPTHLDERQSELLRELAAIRGEESPEGRVQSAQNRSVFDRFKDAFK